MAMASPAASLGRPRPPWPCPSASSCSLVSGHHCVVAFPLPQQPGVGARRQGCYPRMEATARHGARKENAKVRNRRLQKKVRHGAGHLRAGPWVLPASMLQPPPAISRECSLAAVQRHGDQAQAVRLLLQQAALRHARRRPRQEDPLLRQHPAGGNPRRPAMHHRGGRSEGRGGARQGVQGAGHLRGLVLRPQRVRSRGEDDGVRGSHRAARVPAQIAKS